MSTFHHLLSLPLVLLASSSLTTASPLSPRSTTYYGLIFAPNSGCTASQTTQVLSAITDMRALCTSALAALHPPTNPLSSYFFPPSSFSPATANLPTDPSLGYTQIQLSCAPATDATCTTPSPGDNSAAEKTSTTTTWAYIAANPVSGSGSAAQIYACPALLDGTLPRNAAPCTGTPGLATMGWALLRTFVQLKTLQSVPKLATWNTITDHAPRVAQSHALVASGSPDAALNADNFAELAVWALDAGAGGGAGQGFQCPQSISFS